MNNQELVNKISQARKILCEIKDSLNEKTFDYSPDFTIADAISALDELDDEVKTTIGE
jgi:RNA processing factor Prp31